MRKSIFEIASSNINMENEADRIVQMSLSEKTLCISDYTYKSLFAFVDEYCFEEWEYRNHFVDVKDFLESIDFVAIKKAAANDLDALLTLIELVYNFWNLSLQKFNDEDKGYTLQWCGNYYHLQDVMDDILCQYNHIAYTNEEHNCVLVIEDKPEITAVAEIVPSQLSFNVIKYNHKSLQGNIDLKKAILLSLGAELEPKRKQLSTFNKQLADDIFFMLNNCNLRHNNRSKKDASKYKEYIAKMSKKQLEKWYDELYQMILLAFLTLDNEERTTKISNLKSKIVGGN